MAAAAAAAATNPNDTFKILLTTDNHLGYCERDERRRDDSFIAFEEALRHGRVTKDCDMCILGGDLFHENKPSLGTLQRSIRLFRTYCWGDKDVAIELRTDPAVNFPTHPLPIANFQDPNINVAMPVFIIHGNHDDPIGGTSAIDILASAGLVNYFGKVDHVEDIVVRPVILRKGRTQIALYGIGNVRDERMHRALKHGKVTFVRPAAGQDKFFNILVVHQNRGTRGFQSKNGVHDAMFKGFGMDLIIWGNEHEQIMGPTAIDGCNFDIIQPGSTIHTSLNNAETQPKACAVLEVNGTAYVLRVHPLRQVRPVVRRVIRLQDVVSNKGRNKNQPLRKTEDAVEEFLKEQVDEMVEEADKAADTIPEETLRQFPNLRLPVMRLAVDFTDPTPGGVKWPMRNITRFGHRYMEVCVNPADLLREIKPTAEELRARSRAEADRMMQMQLRGELAVGGTGSTEAGQQALQTYNQSLPVDDIRSKISDFLAKHAKDQCVLLAEQELSDAVYAFVEKSEKHAVDERISQLLVQSQKEIWRSVREMPPEQVTAQVIQALAQQQKRRANESFAVRCGQMDAPGGEADDDGVEAGNGNDGDDGNDKISKRGGAAAAAAAATNKRTQGAAAAAAAAAAAGAPKTTAEMLRQLHDRVTNKAGDGSGDVAVPKVDAAHLANLRRRGRDEPEPGDDFAELFAPAGDLGGSDDDDDGDAEDDVAPRAPAAARGGKAKAAPKAAAPKAKGKKKAQAVPDGDIPIAAPAPAAKGRKAASKWMSS